MRSFEIHVAPSQNSMPPSADINARWSAFGTPQLAPANASVRTLASPERTARAAWSPPEETLDVFVRGANVTARIADGHGACVVRDLALALSKLAASSNGKAIVHFYDEPWEMCIERTGHSAFVSVYRAGHEPDVAVYDERVPFLEIVGAVKDAMAELVSWPRASARIDDLVLAQRAIESAASRCELSDDDADRDAAPACIEIDHGSPVSFAADFSLRSQSTADGESAVEHADLHGLLFRGRVRAMVRGRAIDLGGAHPFLFAERAPGLVRRALDAWEHGTALHVREDAGGVLIGIRVATAGDVVLSLGTSGPRAIGASGANSFPALAVVDLAHATIAFGRSLLRAVLRRDRSQGNNLRLSSFRRALRETDARVRGATRDDARVNLSPESYRSFALSQRPTIAHVSSPPPATPSRLRYAPRWRALVPGIDLRSTFLCGDRLVVGASQETFCLDRQTGEVLWRVPTRRATGVVTPVGVARLHADGELIVHDFSNGDVVLRTRLLPRTGAPPAGAVVSTPGLPRLLIVTEGERHMVAVDLASGEPRWRFAWDHGGALRLKRHGKLLYLTSTTTALSALDVTTGNIVWRVRDRLRFCGSPAVDHDLLLAVAGGMGGATTLYAVDAFSGAIRWTSAVPGPDAAGELHIATHDLGHPATVEGSPMLAAHRVLIPVRDRHGVRLAAFDRDTGKLAWTSDATVAPVGTSWLVIDDVILGNTPTGELVGVDVETGALRYRHVLGRMLEADIPRRLEPILRSGAVFVPHTEVRIFRPSDGAPLGVVGPCEAICDLVRVDEKCDVFVAEESGHMAAFGAGPRLSLVR